MPYSEIAGKNEILGKAIVEIRDDNDEDIGAKTINIGKTRGSNHHRRVSKDREIKMHPFSRGIVSMSAKWKRSFQQLSRNSQAIVTRFPLRRTATDCLKQTECGKSEEKKHERWKEEEGEDRLEIDKEDGVARWGEEQKKRLQRLSARKTPRNRRRQSSKGMGRWTR